MDKKDTVSYREFFKAIQARVPEAKIDVIMTDDGKIPAIIRVELKYCISQIRQLWEHFRKCIQKLFTFYVDGMWTGL